MPCQIIKRQTTYWDLREGPQAILRVTFVDKKEHGFISEDAPGFAIVEQHPVLIDYHHRWSKVFVSGPVSESQLIVATLENAISEKVGAWRSAAHYLNPIGASKILESGGGQLLDAPKPIADLCVEALRHADTRLTVLSGRDARGPHKALIAGQNFVVAREFHVASVA